MKRTKYPVKYVRKERVKRLRLDLSNCPNAGPYPNVTGMRLHYWGIDAPIIRVGAYIYKVSPEVYHSV